MFRLVGDGWDGEVLSARRSQPEGLSIACPFIKNATMSRILDAGRLDQIRIVTRFDLSAFHDGVSDIEALERLLAAGARVRGVKHLHAKLFLFGRAIAIGTSANLTEAAMLRNHEFGFVASDSEVVAACGSYFDELWERAGTDLTREQLADWRAMLSIARRQGSSEGSTQLPDYGAEIGLASPFTGPAAISYANQAFLKFFGRGNDRTPRDRPVAEIVAESGCNWACTYPNAFRPRQVANGDVIYMARFAVPNDVLIYGKAIGWRHRDEEDVANAAELAARPWRENWRNYIRVHSAHFVNAELGVGVSMFEMLDALGADSFRATHDNAVRRSGNTNPKTSYLRKPAMRLTDRSRDWIDRRLEQLFRRHGEVDLRPDRFRPPR